jgi:hypothetical protein
MEKLENVLIAMCKEIDKVKVVDKEKAKQLSIKFDAIFEKRDNIVS